MFFKGDSGDLDVKKMSVAKLASEIRATFDDDDFFEMSKEVLLTETPDYKKIMANIELSIRNGRYGKKAGFDYNALAGFHSGVFYGMALATKTVAMTDANDPKSIKKVMTMMALFFTAIEQGSINIHDDKWFENLMKNVKVVPDPLVKPERKKKKK